MGKSSKYPVSLEFLLFFWGCKEVALSLIWHKFSVLCGKNSDYADADVSKLYVCVSPHPVICPVKRGKDISRNRNHNFFPPSRQRRDYIVNLCVFLEIYESETWDAQVDGSLHLTHKVTIL